MAILTSIDLRLARSIAAALPSAPLNISIYETNAVPTVAPNVGDLLGTKAFDVSGITTQQPVFNWYTITFDTPIDIGPSGYVGVHIDWPGSTFSGARVLFDYSSDWSDPPPDGEGKEQWFYNAGVNNGNGMAYRLNTSEGVMNGAVVGTGLYGNWSIPSGWHGIRSSLPPASPEKAITPDPEDTDNGVTNSIPMSITWEDGGEGEANAATSYDVYFGTDFTGPVFQENVAVPTWAIPEDFHDIGDYLNTLQGYTWRIDAVNADGTTEGDEWTFTTSATRGLGKAIIPTPEFEATGISPTVESISWQNGGGAYKYDVYFGPASDDLTKMGTIDATGPAKYQADSFSAGKLGIGGSTTWYWRIDAKNNWGTVIGDVWSFTSSALNSPVPSGQNAALTVRRLVSAARHKIFYEDI